MSPASSHASTERRMCAPPKEGFPRSEERTGAQIDSDDLRFPTSASLPVERSLHLGAALGDRRLERRQLAGRDLEPLLADLGDVALGATVDLDLQRGGTVVP